MGAPIGNQNAVKARPWADAIRRALARAEAAGNGKDLNTLADKLLDAVANGDLAAIKELGDRLDGKPAQTIGGDPEGEPIKLEVGWKQSA